MLSPSASSDTSSRNPSKLPPGWCGYGGTGEAEGGGRGGRGGGTTYGGRGGGEGGGGGSGGGSDGIGEGGGGGKGGGGMKGGLSLHSSSTVIDGSVHDARVPI